MQGGRGNYQPNTMGGSMRGGGGPVGGSGSMMMNPGVNPMMGNSFMGQQGMMGMNPMMGGMNFRGMAPMSPGMMGGGGRGGYNNGMNQMRGGGNFMGGGMNMSRGGMGMQQGGMGGHFNPAFMGMGQGPPPSAPDGPKASKRSRIDGS